MPRSPEERVVHVDPEREGYMKFMEGIFGSENTPLLNWWQPDPECVMVILRSSARVIRTTTA